MRNKREYIRHAVVLILAVASLMIGTTPFLTSSGLVFAQAVAPSWSYTGSLNTERSVYTTTLLPNGKVLVAGGANGTGYLNSAELYDPVTGTWGLTGGPNGYHEGHTATVLPNGKVLFVGGFTFDASNQFLVDGSAELYDPVAGTWSFTDNLNVARGGHSATLLSNGKVLVAGGTGIGSGEQPWRSAELYDPATGTWSTTGSLNTVRFTHTATLLQNGKVLVAGGTQGDFSFDNLNSSELYDPNTGTWSLTGSLNVARLGHTETLLPNGNVLVTGGESQDFGVINKSAELYNPATGTWSYTGSLNTARIGHTATLLPNRQVLVAGGAFCVPGDNRVNCTLLDSAEIYDPAAGKWNGTANLNGPRYHFSAALLQSGKVLVVGGSDGINPGPLLSAQLYDSGSSSIINPIVDPQFFVRQQYLDFLNREPDAPGLTHWAGEITACDDPSRREPGESLALCIERKRTNTSAAFFLSPEFQYTGYFVYRLYKGSLLQNVQNGAGRPPTYQEFLRDVRQVANGIIQNNQLSAAVIEANKKTFAEQFTQRPEFRSLYDPLSNFDYVERLFQTTGINVSAPEKQALVDGLNNQTETRASVLQKVVDGTVVIAEGNQQFTTPYGRAFYEKGVQPGLRPDGILRLSATRPGCAGLSALAG